MKWFKHDTDAHMSEGIDALINKFGFEGYGRWNRLLEIVASKMDRTDRCHAEYSVQKWCSLLGLKQKKLSSFLELTENKLRTKVVRFDNKIRIEIPNLLKKRDKYTSDLQVKDKLLTSKKKREEERRKNKEKEEEKKPPAVKLSDEEWLETLKINPAYEGLDIEKIKGKMEAWCVVNHKQPTRRRLINWLNREDKPIKPLSFAEQVKRDANF